MFIELPINIYDKGASELLEDIGVELDVQRVRMSVRKDSVVVVRENIRPGTCTIHLSQGEEIEVCTSYEKVLKELS